MLSEQEVVKWFGSRGCFALYGFAVVYVGLKFRCLMFYLTDKTTHKLGKFCSSNTQDNSGCNETTSKYVCLFVCLFCLQIVHSDPTFHHPDYMVLLWNIATCCSCTHHLVHSVLSPYFLTLWNIPEQEETSQLPLAACSWASGMYVGQLLLANKRVLLSMTR